MWRLPDWVIYSLVLGVILFVTFTVASPQRENATPSLEGSEKLGPLLPPPSAFDREILVEVGPAQSGLGTAFAINPDGWWLTARHVVDDCDTVGIIVSKDTAARAEVHVAPFADLALLHTDGAPVSLAMDLSEDDLRVGQQAFHVGYPQGRNGEAASRLIGREKLIARGRYRLEQSVLAWVETGRTEGLTGSLAGISGGPVFDQEGRVIGVTLAESSRRGRLYTASPATIQRLLERNDPRVTPRGDQQPRITATNYGNRADSMRRALAVVRVICIAGGQPRDPTI